jgi:hypothetical protein
MNNNRGYLREKFEMIFDFILRKNVKIYFLKWL